MGLVFVKSNLYAKRVGTSRKSRIRKTNDGVIYGFPTSDRLERKKLNKALEDLEIDNEVTNTINITLQETESMAINNNRISDKKQYLSRYIHCRLSPSIKG